MPVNGHLEWNVKYRPGILSARGYKGGKEIISDEVRTAGEPAGIQLSADRTTLQADGEDVSVITVSINDAQDGWSRPQIIRSALRSQGPVK